MVESFYSKQSYNWQTNSDELFELAWNLLFTEAKKSLGNINGRKLLDAGCGMGRFYPYVSESDYMGMDISEDNVRKAASVFNKTIFSVGNILQTDFKDDYFDALVSIEVIEHLTIDELSVFLKEVSRITKRGARIVITTPNLYYLWGIIPWSFCPLRRRLTFRKLFKGIKDGYVDENYNLPVSHYRFKPRFLKQIISEYLVVSNVKSTYWFNNRAIHNLVPKFQLKLLKFSNHPKFLIGSQLVIECENNK